ncbi:TaqI-like C-terminal specificity domain-containing protein [Myroides odoratimimus]|uniref:TaqI-like C-terminal specificity domain-containing protein n=1 Tax=Myroides odoratimimus TaxID=76832 RepID=UPI0025779540|nr:TaqI-like C-terminal specificity domain-containing protein [Myroides odoratimimus]
MSSIEKQIKDKIEAIGTPLKEWDININYGIKTGFNEAFIITGEKRKELIDEDPKSAEIIRPILRGRDIKRYGYDFADLWLINTHNGIKEKNTNRIYIEDYPSIKKHLEQYYPRLEKRSDKGDTPYNLRSCAYLEEFYKQKIVWKAVGRNLTFALLEEGSFLTAPASFITSNNNVYILAFLSSSFGKYYIYNNSDTTGAGDIMLNIQSLEKIPIPKPTKDIEEKVNILINKILFNKKNGITTSDLELEINYIIYSIFNFNNQEIEFMEAL